MGWSGGEGICEEGICEEGICEEGICEEGILEEGILEEGICGKATPPPVSGGVATGRILRRDCPS